MSLFSMIADIVSTPSYVSMKVWRNSQGLLFTSLQEIEEGLKRLSSSPFSFHADERHISDMITEASEEIARIGHFQTHTFNPSRIVTSVPDFPFVNISKSRGHDWYLLSLQEGVTDIGIQEMIQSYMRAGVVSCGIARILVQYPRGDVGHHAITLQKVLSGFFAPAWDSWEKMAEMLSAAQSAMEPGVFYLVARDGFTFQVEISMYIPTEPTDYSVLSLEFTQADTDLVVDPDCCELYYNLIRQIANMVRASR